MTKTVPETKRARGRPRGSGNQQRSRTLVLAQAEIKPLEVLMQTMAERWNTAQAMPQGTEERAKALDAACAVARDVAPYLHARLQATTIKGDADQPLSFTVSLPASDVLRGMIRGESVEKHES